LARPVLFLHPSATRYGADLQLHALVTGLDPARYRPLVVLPERGELGPWLDESGVEVHIQPVAVLRRALVRGSGLASTVGRLARDRRRLGDLARRAEVALVHTNTSAVLSGQSVAGRAGAPHLLHLREVYDGAGGRAGSALWPLLRRQILRADAVVCVSAAAAAQLGPAPNVSVIHDAPTRVPERTRREEARRALGIPDGRFAVAVVGRISDWKGQEVLVRALAEPPLADVGAIGLVAGDAAPGQEHFQHRLLELGGRLGLNGRLRLTGFQPDLGAVLGAADAVAVPSAHPDAFPNAALEAAAAAMPLVASAIGGMAEIVSDGATGRLVPAADARALAAALRELADDPGTASRLGAAAAKDVGRRFPMRRALGELQALYDRLCTDGRRAARGRGSVPPRP
jgi:glycosyltransferase involved in cell wall biosynthesis